MLSDIENIPPVAYSVLGLFPLEKDGIYLIENRFPPLDV
jgi:hypothetical protein